jgi:hypothetical protein
MRRGVATIAVVYWGTEAARHRYADLPAWLRDVRTLPSTRGLQFDAYADSEADYLLDGIDPRDYSCVVFASNALKGDAVQEAVARHATDLDSYAERGGGLVVLHQYIEPDDLSRLFPFLRDEYRLALQASVDVRGAAVPIAVNSEDILLRFPAATPAGGSGSERGTGPRPLHWRTLDGTALGATFLPVLTSGKEGAPILARTLAGARRRVVVSTVPLDWHDQRALFVNAVSYAARGEPARVWLGAAGDHRLRSWLDADGRTVEATRASKDSSTWALSRAHLLVVPQGDDLDKLASRPEMLAFFERGGIAVTSRSPVKAGSKFEALVGQPLDRDLIDRVAAELRATAWEGPFEPYGRRNVVSLLKLLNDLHATWTGLTLDTTRLTHVREVVIEQLRSRETRRDVGSSVAHAHVLGFVESGDFSEHVAWLSDQNEPSEDVKLQIEAVRRVARREPASAWLERAAAWADRSLPGRDGEEPSPPLGTARPASSSHRGHTRHAGDGQEVGRLVRVFDTLAVLARLGLLPRDVAPSVTLAERCCDVLESHGLDPRTGWFSRSTTADLACGLAALFERNLRGTEVAVRVEALLAEAAVYLRGALTGYRRTDRGLGELCRMVEALLVIERASPLAIKHFVRAEWPQDDPSVDSSAADELSLARALAHEVDRIRVENERLAESARAARSGQFLGAAVAAALVAVVLVLSLRQRGPDNFGEGLSQIALPTLLAAIVALGLLRWAGLLLPELERTYKRTKDLVDRLVGG